MGTKEIRQGFFENKRGSLRNASCRKALGARRSDCERADVIFNLRLEDYICLLARTPAPPTDTQRKRVSWDASALRAL